MGLKAAIFLFLLLNEALPAAGQKTNQAKLTSSESIPARTIKLEEELQVFDRLDDSARYLLSLCADVPLNSRPRKLVHEGETGHVFLIFRGIRPAGDTINKVFGFYPKSGGLPAMFTRNVKSKIRDNSGRQYDAAITVELDGQGFDTALRQALVLSRRRYELNSFNCYDYALAVYNAVAGKDTIEKRYAKFPFVFGRGGSPCTLYESLKALGQMPGHRKKIGFTLETAPLSTPVQKAL